MDGPNDRRKLKAKAAADAGAGDEGEPPKMVAELMKWLEDDAVEGEEEGGAMEPAALAELMKWLEDDDPNSGSSFVAPSPPYSSTSSSSSFCIPSTSFVTINGNEESCGPSFSGNASTVMASIDTRGNVAGALPYFMDCATWPCPAPSTTPWAGGSVPKMVAGSAGAAGEAMVDGGGDDIVWASRASGVLGS